MTWLTSESHLILLCFVVCWKRFEMFLKIHIFWGLVKRIWQTNDLVWVDWRAIRLWESDARTGLVANPIWQIYYLWKTETSRTKKHLLTFEPHFETINWPDLKFAPRKTNLSEIVVDVHFSAAAQNTISPVLLHGSTPGWQPLFSTHLIGKKQNDVKSNLQIKSYSHEMNRSTD